DYRFNAQKERPVLLSLHVFQQQQSNRRRNQHADRLAGNRGHHHPRPNAFRQNFRDVSATHGKIDADSHPDEKWADKKHRWSVRERTDRGTRTNNYHVGEHQSSAAKTIGYWPANSGPENTTQDQSRANKADYPGSDMKLSDDERHRDAESKNGEAIKQRAPRRERPKPSWNGFQRRLIQ